MALKLRYIEDNYYEVEDWFVEKLREYPRLIGFEIAKQVEYSWDTLPEKYGWTQRVGGVCTRTEEPFFFEVEYLNQPDEAPVFLDVEAIEVDDYLDYIIENKTLKSNRNESEIRTTDSTESD